MDKIVDEKKENSAVYRTKAAIESFRGIAVVLVSYPVSLAWKRMQADIMSRVAIVADEPIEDHEHGDVT